MLRQFILLAGGKPLDFQDPRLSAALARCAQLDALDLPYSALEDTEFCAAITADDLNALLGYCANECEIIPPARAGRGRRKGDSGRPVCLCAQPPTARIRRRRSPTLPIWRKTALTAQLRCCVRTPPRRATRALPKRRPSWTNRSRTRGDALAAGTPENRPTLQESLDALLDEQEMMEADNDSWIINPDALNRYRAL